MSDRSKTIAILTIFIVAILAIGCDGKRRRFDKHHTGVT